MLQLNITSKQELMRLLQAANINKVVAKDIRSPEDLNDFKKESLALLQKHKSITAFLVVS
jgi:hypothetical protein